MVSVVPQLNMSEREVLRPYLPATADVAKLHVFGWRSASCETQFVSEAFYVKHTDKRYGDKIFKGAIGNRTEFDCDEKATKIPLDVGSYYTLKLQNVPTDIIFNLDLNQETGHTLTSRVMKSNVQFRVARWTEKDTGIKIVMTEYDIALSVPDTRKIGSDHWIYTVEKKWQEIYSERQRNHPVCNRIENSHDHELMIFLGTPISFRWTVGKMYSYHGKTNDAVAKYLAK